MAKATVAYENAREARRKLKAVKPLRWHRMDAEGRYEAKGERGRYVLMSRSPNRRKGVFPWTVLLGSMRGAEIKPGGFDLKGDAATFASQYDAGLCGAPAVVVQAPSPQGLPPGVYRGTAAEARRPGNPLNTYFEKVDAELQKMGFDQPGQASTMSADSTEYVSRMFDAKVDPAITAAVLVATKGHHHDHDCPGKHVELAEGGAREDRAGGDTYKVQYKDMTGVTWVDFVQALDDEDAERIARMHAKQMRHPMHSAVGVQRVSEAAMEEAKRQHISQASWDMLLRHIESHPDYDIPRFDPVTGGKLSDLDRKKLYLASLHRGSFAGAEESKKRLPQPDPSSGYYITHSSLTRDLWLMHEDRLVARSTDRGELLRKAEQLSESSEAAEARRPKGRRHR